MSHPEPRTRRRTNAVSGFVNFPVDNPDLPSDGQGGMFVRLVVYDRKADEDYYNRWVCCCGGSQNFHYDECYIRDDASLKKHNELSKEEVILAELASPEKYFEAVIEKQDDPTNERFHFPWLHLDEETSHRYESRSYLCIMTIGSTGWSNVEWTCTYEDLTEKGKTLYNLLQELYPDCELYLQTWLDT